MVHLGLETNIDQLRALGTHGLFVALWSSMLPFGMGYGVAYGLGYGPKACFTIATALSPTAVGVTAKVLHRSHVLHTPTGQLIITSTVIDDLIAIMLLGELKAMHKGTTMDYIWPVFTPVLGCLIVGYLAMHVFPDLIEFTILPNIPARHRDHALLLLVGGMTIGLTRAAHEGRAFFLMGAFLTGLCFSTCHEVHHMWEHQIKRIQYALLRVFYGASIAFEVPAKGLKTGKVWGHGFAFASCLIAKVAAGFTNTSIAIGGKFDYREWLRVGLSLAVWGEITLLVGVTGKEEGLISKKTFASLVIATLLSVFFGPLALYLRLKFDREARRANNLIKEKHLAIMKDGIEELPHFLFYTIDVSCRSKWGLLQRFLKVAAEHSLEIIDFRVHGGHHSGHDDVMFEMYLKDTLVLAPLTKHQLEVAHVDYDALEALDAVSALDKAHDVAPSVDTRQHSAHMKIGGLLPVRSHSPELEAPPSPIDNPDADEVENMQRNWASGKPHIASLHEVKLRIQDLCDAYSAEVTHDPRVAELGGVVIKRWEPPLDDDHPEDDDEMAIRFAEHVMHRIQYDKSGEHGYAFEDEVHRTPFERVEHEHLPPALTDLNVTENDIEEYSHRRTTFLGVRRRGGTTKGDRSHQTTQGTTDPVVVPEEGSIEAARQAAVASVRAARQSEDDTDTKPAEGIASGGPGVGYIEVGRDSMHNLEAVEDDHGAGRTISISLVNSSSL
mmetsp:Transcript_24534/g.73514  ORF Transcript_24534/g.73514 Transcript_24534/m.73514 type:complete len:724 (-) Transcript_24534:88-2259(-)